MGGSGTECRKPEKKRAGSKKYEIIKSSSFEKIEDKFDVIMSNPPIRTGKNVIFNIYEESFRHLNEDGEFLLCNSNKARSKKYAEKIRKSLEIAKHWKLKVDIEYLGVSRVNKKNAIKRSFFSLILFYLLYLYYFGFMDLKNFRNSLY